MKNFAKRFISYLLIIVMVATVFVQAPVVASAEDTEAVLTYTISDGVATITNVSAEAIVVEIPAEYEGCPVVGTDQFAFEGNSKTTEFIVDENSEYFSTDEFGVLYNKDKSRLIKFPDSSGVTEYVVPEGVTDLAYHAFAYSGNLEKVSCPSTLKSIGKYDFFHCFSLVEVVLEEGIVSIVEESFRESTLLSKINFPSTIRSIGEGAFQGCNLSGVIELPESLSSLGADSDGKSYPAAVFNGCRITAFSIDENNGFFSTDENGILYDKYKTTLLDCPDAIDLTSVVVPESVTAIDNYAFSKVSGLKSITLHDSVYSIGTRAFAYSGIVSFAFPKNLTQVSDGMFYHCVDLVQVDLHDNIGAICDSAFSQCSSLETLDIPSSCYSIGASAFSSTAIKSITLPIIAKVSNSLFRSCKKLESVTFTGYLTAIGESAFYGCSSLKSIDIPSSVTEIGKEAFLASGLETVALPDGITTIETSVFNGCRSLVSIEIPRSVTTIKKAFAGSLDSFTDVNYHGTEEQWNAINIEDGNTGLDSAKITYEYNNISYFTYNISNNEVTIKKCNFNKAENLVIPDEICGYPVTRLADDSFVNLKITGVKLPADLKTIGIRAFSSCVNLKEIEIPDKVEVIDKAAFYNTGIETLNIPESVVYVSRAYPEKLKEFIVDENNLHYSSEDGVLFNKEKTVLLTYPHSKEDVLYYVPATVTEIGDYAFSESIVAEIKLPDGVQTIGKYAFDGCTVNTINIPSSVKTISDGAFKGSGVESIVIPESVEYIGQNIFSNCENLKSADLRCKVTVIPARAFSHCYSLEKVQLPETIVEIDDNVFYYDKNLVNLILPKNLESIGFAAFYNCYGLKNFQLPDTVTLIEGSAFVGCKSLEKINLPEKLIKLDGEVFDGCENLVEITIGPDLVEFKETSFNGVNVKLERIKVDPANPALMSDNAGVLYSKDKTKLIKFPAAATVEEYTVEPTTEVINQYAFYYNKNLDTIILPVTLKSVGKYAFYNMEKLINVYYTSDEDDWNLIYFDSGNTDLETATVRFNYSSDRILGENIFWSFDEETKALVITGSGEMLNLASAEDYGWYFFKDEIETVEFANSVTSVSDYAFSGYPNLKEVYLGQGVGKIGENSFADCPALAIVTSRAINLTAEDSSFGNNDSRLVLLYNSSATQAADYASAHGMKHIPVYYDSEKKVINYKGALTVYSDLPYLFLSKLVKENPEAEYLYFEKLVFDGVETGLFDIEELQNDAQAQYLTFNNLYVSLKKIKDNSAEGVTFEAFITLLENGDYDSFIFELVSDEGEQQLTFVEVLEKVTDFLITNALRVTSKIINFFRKLFK